MQVPYYIWCDSFSSRQRLTLLRLSRSAKEAFLVSVEKNSGVKESTRKKAELISALIAKAGRNFYLVLVHL